MTTYWNLSQFKLQQGRSDSSFGDVELRDKERASTEVAVGTRVKHYSMKMLQYEENSRSSWL